MSSDVTVKLTWFLKQMPRPPCVSKTSEHVCKLTQWHSNFTLISILYNWLYCFRITSLEATCRLSNDIFKMCTKLISSEKNYWGVQFWKLRFFIWSVGQHLTFFANSISSLKTSAKSRQALWLKPPWCTCVSGRQGNNTVQSNVWQ